MAPVSWTTQRVALPQLSTSPPSLFQMRMRRSALSTWLKHDQLVAANTSAPVGNGSASDGRDVEWLLARIDDHEIIAEAMHLVEGPFHAWRGT